MLPVSLSARDFERLITINEPNLIGLCVQASFRATLHPAPHTKFLNYCQNDHYAAAP
jgi:hypothetical protein